MPRAHWKHRWSGQSSLVPKPDFATRKVWVWALIGPANPMIWAMLPFSGVLGPSVWSASLLFALPGAIGGAIALARLKRETIGRTGLFDHVLRWALLTIPIYTFLGFVATSVIGSQMIDNLNIWQILETIRDGIVFGVAALPFAAMIGVLPAMIAAWFCFLLVEAALFDLQIPQSAAD